MGILLIICIVLFVICVLVFSGLMIYVLIEKKRNGKQKAKN